MIIITCRNQVDISVNCCALALSTIKILYIIEIFYLDIDECESQADRCDPVSTTCVNTIGSNTCRCRSGFVELNATHCEGMNYPCTTIV